MKAMFPAHNSCTDKKFNRVASRCGDLLRQVVEYEGTVLSAHQRTDIDLGSQRQACLRAPQLLQGACRN